MNAFPKDIAIYGNKILRSRFQRGGPRRTKEDYIFDHNLRRVFKFEFVKCEHDTDLENNMVGIRGISTFKRFGIKPRNHLLEIKAMRNWNKLVYNVRTRKKLYREHIPYENSLDYDLMNEEDTIEYLSQDLTDYYTNKEQAMVPRNRTDRSGKTFDYLRDCSPGFNIDPRVQPIRFGCSITYQTFRGGREYQTRPDPHG